MAILYTVGSGDSLTKIAKHLSLTLKLLLKLNPQFGPTGFRSSDLIYAGERIVVGVGATSL